MGTLVAAGCGFQGARGWAARSRWLWPWSRLSPWLPSLSESQRPLPVAVCHQPVETQHITPEVWRGQSSQVQG